MINRLLSFIASILMLFQFLFPAQPAIKQSSDALKEPQPQADPMRNFDKIEGVSGSEFYIERPSTELKEVKASQFGVDADKADNFNEIKNALGYCINNPNTKLTFDEGTYYLDNKTQLPFKGMRNILIDGNGARLVFSNVVLGLEINGSDCVELNNIKFDWDWEKRPLSDIVTVRNASPKTNTLEFLFEGKDEVSEDTFFSALSQCDPDTLTYGAKYSNKEVYVYQRPEMIKSVKKIDKNVLQVEHDGSFKRFENGDKFILRHYVYDTTFAVINNGSKNITFDNVSVYGYPGSGFLANSKASHFQIINSYIGVEPDKKAERHTSLGADAIHIANSDGCFNIANCDISGQGDDALNVHDGLGWVKSVDGNKITLEATAVYMRAGDVLKFRDDFFNETDVTATIKEITYNSSGANYDITFTEDISDKIGLNYIAYNMSCSSENYVVRNNYIHENRARGFLLQSSNGLCENNVFYKTEMQAIKIVMDISPGLWYEGTGVDNLEVRGNQFLWCNYVGLGETITIGSNIGGKTATSEPFTNIIITDNVFEEVSKRVLNADNVNGLVFTENKIDAGKEMPKSKTSARAYFGEYCVNITFKNNQWQNCIAGEIAKTKKPYLWAIINSK